MSNDLLAIYLNDHLAGATVGVLLARRALRENQRSELGSFLSGTLVPEIAQDRAALRRVMSELGVAESHPKLLAAWAVEKVGRLKPNGRLRSYSPLSRLLELEGLAAGIEGKRALWLSLATMADRESGLARFDFPGLADRALSQRERLEPHRLTAAMLALGGPS
jgi:hypothetical protein